ncbi:hydroxymethylpyrimidine kinase/phosphomethylpyrimidine kinase [Leptospira broomii serovar Hurstbridge str. 5399]|uniref:hydroxymethylpyrimidine kinase n=1 Tax=Leptospira broomii serovar Hurstbridge str. 5399 TaxID=1049789 RepID=T0GG40_9LEPT|nr:bifunctional hydroxymethylpyrimidine kinase/phosphomethylpyrimidine kinase [Leptospira broomii]EQA45809.1 hydroxymethylpyrimidine kinase/phosphomethylpyrimidine kinase [Leptospira broomii serovar Hurstbridge str. 5399]
MTSVRPVILTIAGSDSGGGAGIQADLKTINAIGNFGTSALTCLTAQNPDGVSGILEVDPDFLEKQIRAVFSYFPVAAIKTGMLFSQPLISRLSALIREFKAAGSTFRLVVDPVMVATSGAKLLQDNAIESLIQELIPLADLITPNLDEANLLGIGIVSSISDMRPAAEFLSRKYGTNVLLKGGHLRNVNEATDVLSLPNGDTTVYSKPFVPNFYPHGTGCTYSSAIASYWGKNHSLSEAISLAKEFLHAAIEQAYSIGKSKTLNHNPKIY